MQDGTTNAKKDPENDPTRLQISKSPLFLLQSILPALLSKFFTAQKLHNEQIYQRNDLQGWPL